MNEAIGSRVLIAGGIGGITSRGRYLPGLTSAELYEEQAQQFIATDSITEGRVGHTATLLEKGAVLVAGGDGAETDRPVASAELYDPETGTFHQMANMSVARVGHTATFLRNGLVLMAGGQDATFTNQRTAEVFDPKTGIFRVTGNMNDARTGHTATLLPNSEVLVAGGENGTTILSSAELYDLATGAFRPTGSMTTPRLFGTATLLRDGRVLIAGGGSIVANCMGCSIASAEVYDPTTGIFKAAESMRHPRRGHVAVLLRNGSVLLAGGIDDDLPSSQRFLSSAELFNPKSLTFSPTSSMTCPRFNLAASLLQDGAILVTGGFTGAFTITNTAELYYPDRGSFVGTGVMTQARAEHTSTSLMSK